MGYSVEMRIIDRVKRLVNEDFVKDYIYGTTINSIDLVGLQCEVVMGDYLNPHWWAHFHVNTGTKWDPEAVTVQFNPNTGDLINR